MKHREKNFVGCLTRTVIITNRYYFNKLNKISIVTHMQHRKEDGGHLQQRKEKVERGRWHL